MESRFALTCKSILKDIYMYVRSMLKVLRETTLILCMLSWWYRSLYLKVSFTNAAVRYSFSHCTIYLEATSINPHFSSIQNWNKFARSINYNQSTKSTVGKVSFFVYQRSTLFSFAWSTLTVDFISPFSSKAMTSSSVTTKLWYQNHWLFCRCR